MHLHALFQTNNMAQQTAVEWLEEQLNKWSDGRFYLPPHLFEQAKQMEEKQHSNTFLAGGRSAFNAAKGRDFATFEDYYNETYKKE
jgi:hypothetical protein